MGETIAKTGVQARQGPDLLHQGWRCLGLASEEAEHAEGQGDEDRRDGRRSRLRNFMYYVSTTRTASSPSSVRAPGRRQQAQGEGRREVGAQEGGEEAGREEGGEEGSREEGGRQEGQAQVARAPPSWLCPVRQHCRMAVRSDRTPFCVIEQEGRLQRLAFLRVGLRRPEGSSGACNPRCPRVFAVAFHRRGEASSTFTRGEGRAGDGPQPVVPGAGTHALPMRRAVAATTG